MRERFGLGWSAMIWAVAVLVVLSAGVADAGTKDVVASMDALVAAAYGGDGPGAAVLVLRDGKPLLRKGYGLADLELRVPVQPEMVFRIGSITKQFTAVAVMMLVEEGKVALDDPITEHLPDYPTGDAIVTVEQLLDHTSGITSYTNLSQWPPLQRKDMTLEELIGLFRDLPLEFEPGERWRYNNSAYVLLGAVIEQGSGMSYQEFVQQRIFDPLGMGRSYYGAADPIIPGRVRGYVRGRDGFVNAPYLSMTQPYAAGSLLSTVDDLAVWNQAVVDGRLISRETLERVLTPARLADGSGTGYGFGFFVTEYQGRRVVEHGGGIHGFMSYALAIPEERVYVAVLTNATGGGPERNPETLAVNLAGLAMGAPYVEPEAVTPTPETAAALEGVYAGRDEQKVFIRVENGKILYQRTGGSRTEILASDADEFFFPGSFSRLFFHRDESGAVTGLRVVSRLGPAMVFARTNEELPGEREAVAVAVEILQRYVGEYEIAPTFTLTVTLDGEQLMTQATGQEQVAVYAESETAFFLKVVDARLEFELDEAGEVTGLVLHQAGREFPARKLR